MTNTIEHLTTRAEGIYGGSGRAIDWVKDARQTSDTVDGVGDTIIEELRRHRYKSKRLVNALSRPLSVGVFGVSQAGKSFLISTLAMDEQGQLETDMGSDRLNFINHINPSGGGGEATGLVTRFTRRKSDTPAGYPVEVKLLSEAEIIKILGNSYAYDFDPKSKTPLTADQIDAHVVALESRKQTQHTGKLDEDSMVELMDYFRNLPGDGMDAFWNKAVDLAPYLDLNDRAVLLSVLWGGAENQGLADAYRSMVETLDTLGHSGTAYCALDALVQPSDSADSKYSQRDSIVNVNILSRLGKDDDDLVKVLPGLDDGGFGSEVGVPRSAIAALVAELKIVLAEQPKSNVMDKLDLLDFPGYRGRLKALSLCTIEADGDIGPVASLLLRGKVAYLFSRYIDNQEMSMLLLCTRSNNQIEINELADAVNNWVEETQGESAEERAKRLPGLIWTFTQLDLKMSFKGSESFEMRKDEWDQMVWKLGLERFDRCKWVEDWGGTPFDNMYLVRKPGLAADLFDTDKQSRLENGIRVDMEEHMDLLHKTFIEAEAVKKHFADPDAAWKAMVTPNDGGMSRIADYLIKVANPQHKADRIGAQVDAITVNIIDGKLGGMHVGEGTEEISRKNQMADEISLDLTTSATFVADFLYALQPDTDYLRRLYLQSEDASINEGDTATSAAPAEPTSGGFGGGFVTLPGIASAPQAVGAAPADTVADGGSMSRSDIFVADVMRDWQRHMSRLSNSAAVQSYMGISADTVNKITTELSAGASRMKLGQTLSASLSVVENRTGATRNSLVEQQVKVTARAINNFVDYLGLESMELSQRPASDADASRQIFQRPEEPFRELPVQPVNFTGSYIVDWFQGFRKMAIDNVGHSGGRDITPDLNMRLGTILGEVRGSDDP